VRITNVSGGNLSGEPTPVNYLGRLRRERFKARHGCLALVGSTEPGGNVRVALPVRPLAGLDGHQKGFTITMTTMTTSSNVGTSLAIR
jgi:hypothetical protein